MLLAPCARRLAPMLLLLAVSVHHYKGTGDTNDAFNFTCK